MTSYAIRTHRLTRDFGSVRALDELTLDVPAGTVFGLLGPNGAGKTTLIRVLLGLIRPTSGTADVFGRNVTEQPELIRAHSGVLLEHCGLYERLTAAQNLDLYGRFWQMGSGVRAGRIAQVLKALNLWDRRDEVVAGWSRGMKQKLAIARALFHRPSLIFLDEPTAGLDPVAARALRSDLTHLTVSDGVTVFLTTHNLAEVEQLCSNVALIREGRLVATGTPDGLRGPKASLEDAFVEMMEAKP